MKRTSVFPNDVSPCCNCSARKSERRVRNKCIIHRGETILKPVAANTTLTLNVLQKAEFRLNILVPNRALYRITEIKKLCFEMTMKCHYYGES